MQRRSHHNKAYCEVCGEASLDECPKCKNGIRGEFSDGWVNAHYTAPAFCHNCGASFPWTERKQRAALELFAEEIQEEADRREFAANLEQNAKETPPAQNAPPRIGKQPKRLTRNVATGARE